ncbi:DNA gyrase inhibitor YacG [Stutzerimonas azotifigens]|uniref:DNA gyrase inhibitor YacG n=1 Tax=Stutzerimonas azotifigens TaxID=291995 RepID=UPI0004185069|nr:DNA gyrase inhibitor YacG [Stutzerimonas azotifigens]
MNSSIHVECPTCGAPVEWSSKSPHRPFCSDRCKLIDLGAWASGEHAIPGDELEDDLLSGDLPPREH